MAVIHHTARQARVFADAAESDLGLSTNGAAALERILRAIDGLPDVDAAQILEVAAGVVSGEYSINYPAAAGSAR